ncbi:hypothetical protein NBRC10513v2_007415 [Rhodotorula toruloides]
MATLAAPSLATSSRPTTPSAPFDPSAYLSTDFPPLPAFPHDFDDAALQNGLMVGIDPAATTSSGSGGSSGSPAGMGGLGLGQPGGSGSFATGQGMVRTHSGSSSSGGSAGARGPVTRLRSGAVPPPGSRSGGGAGGGGGFISFDPDRGSDLEDDEEEDEERQVEGRPKKRKSVRDLRSAATAQAQASAPPPPPPVAAAVTSKSEGEGGADGGEDKARRKIQIEYIEEKSKRHITFSKRKAGIMKKAYELSTLTGTQVLLLVVSESGWVYTFTTDKFKPLVKEDENGQLSAGQKLIAACLEAKDGPPNLSAAYQPTTASSTGNFEANSSVHGGQISLKTGQRSVRPIATNRRVSGKARPAAIQPPPPMPLPLPTPPQGLMTDPTLPVPPNSAGMQMGQLPSPLSGGGGGGYLDPSPISPHGPRGSYPPRSGGAGGSYSLQQQQQQDYAEMMQRADMLQLQQQQGGGQGGSGAGGGGGYDYDLYSTVPVRYRSPLSQDDSRDRPDVLFDLFPPTPPLRRQPSSTMAPSHASQYYPSHDSHGLPPLPQQPQHDAGHPSLHHQRSFSHSHSVPHTPHRTLHHQASHGHLSASAAQQQQQQQSEYSDPYAQQNYTHHRDPSMMDPRNGGGWQTPHHHLQQQESGSAQGTPVGVRQGQQHALYAGGDDGYAR